MSLMAQQQLRLIKFLTHGLRVTGATLTQPASQSSQELRIDDEILSHNIVQFQRCTTADIGKIESMFKNTHHVDKNHYVVNSDTLWYASCFKKTEYDIVQQDLFRLSDFPHTLEDGIHTSLDYTESNQLKEPERCVTWTIIIDRRTRKKIAVINYHFDLTHQYAVYGPVILNSLITQLRKISKNIIISGCVGESNIVDNVDDLENFDDMDEESNSPRTLASYLNLDNMKSLDLSTMKIHNDVSSHVYFSESFHVESFRSLTDRIHRQTNKNQSSIDEDPQGLCTISRSMKDYYHDNDAKADEASSDSTSEDMAETVVNTIADTLTDTGSDDTTQNEISVYVEFAL